MKTEERFLKYVSYPTMSDETSDTVPSTEKQRILGRELVRELSELGLEDARIDEYGYVYATLPANAEATDTIGFIAHMDTSDAAPDAPAAPRQLLYSGGDIVLNEEKNIVLREEEYPNLVRYRGERLIVTDGTTLLGGDDKAGIAEIMTMLEFLVTHPDMKHGTVKIAFTPDEEIGCGADHFDVAGFGADYAYTVDGGALGELEYENFNAASARVVIHGRSIPPGDAKNKMKNASGIAFALHSMLPADQIPEKTEGYEGFHHLVSMQGSVERAELHYIIRDHDYNRFIDRKTQFAAVCEEINRRFGAGTAELELHDSYYNMKAKLIHSMYIVDRAKSAMLALGIQPSVKPIRGGTDGARLSFMGLPCPNLCTGDENAHSRFEFVSVDAMQKISALLIKIACDLIIPEKQEEPEEEAAASE